MADEQHNKIKIAIVGGGIAGLALAAGLHRKHADRIDFHVYEAATEYKDVGAGLALHLNAIKAMTTIGPEVRRAYFDKASDMGEEDQEVGTEIYLAQGPSKGEMVAELGRAKGRKSITRADLLEGYLGLIPGGRMSLGMRMVGIEEGDDGIVRVKFQDGSVVEVDCLIAADGIHSFARGYVLGAEHEATEPKNHEGWDVYRTTVPMDYAMQHIDKRWRSVVFIGLGPRGQVNCLPVNNGTRLNAGVAIRGAQFTGAKLDPAMYSDYSEEAQQIVRMVARDPSTKWKAIDHDHAPTYIRGRVAMIGDAAHASLPFAGNGAAQALEDSAVLDRLFSQLSSPDQIGALLAAYDATRRPRSQAVVDLARKFGRVYAYAEEGIRDDAARIREFFKGAAAYTNNFDVEGQNEDAMGLFVKTMKGEP